MSNLRQFLPDLGFDGGFGAFREQTDIYPVLGVAIIDVEPERLRKLALKEEDELGGVSVGREHIIYPPLPIPDGRFSRSEETLDLLGVTDKHFGNVKVMILDTGLETDHPDFVSKNPTALPFEKGQKETRDFTGHGTHCAGLIAGPLKPSDQGPRYGVAPGAELVAGRVMSSDTGSADDNSLCAALTWAMQNGAVIVNMSFGGTVDFDDCYPQNSENMFARAFQAGILLVAAAGDDPEDAQYPVKYPANCPSVMAVGAVDGQLSPAAFSCAGINKDQLVDVVAPGVMIRSSFVGKTYKELSGTSMSAALVSGIAALWADTDSALRGDALWKAVVGSTRKLRLGKPVEVGAGLVQAPHLA